MDEFAIYSDISQCYNPGIFIICHKMATIVIDPSQISPDGNTSASEMGERIYGDVPPARIFTELKALEIDATCTLDQAFDAFELIIKSKDQDRSLTMEDLRATYGYEFDSKEWAIKIKDGNITNEELNRLNGFIQIVSAYARLSHIDYVKYVAKEAIKTVKDSIPKIHVEA